MNFPTVTRPYAAPPSPLPYEVGGDVGGAAEAPDQTVMMALPTNGKGWVYLGSDQPARMICGPVELGRFDWINGRYPLARKDFARLRERLIQRGWDVDEFRQNRVGTHKCDLRCVYAKGDMCHCSCGGRNHKGTTGKVVGETTVILPGATVWVHRRYEALS